MGGLAVSSPEGLAWERDPHRHRDDHRDIRRLFVRGPRMGITRVIGGDRNDKIQGFWPVT